MQRHRTWLTAGGQQLLDIVHMGSRLVLRRKLLQRNERGSQRFGDHPFVVTCDALLWHWTALPIILSPLAPGSLTLPGDPMSGLTKQRGAPGMA